MHKMYRLLGIVCEESIFFSKSVDADQIFKKKKIFFCNDWGEPL